MIVKKQNEDKKVYDKIKYSDSSNVNMNNSDSTRTTDNFTNSTSPTSNSIHVKSSFKNMVSDADGGITEFRNTGKYIPSSGITKSKMENTAGNAGNKQNKSQVAQLLNHIKKNGVKICKCFFKYKI